MYKLRGTWSAGKPPIFPNDLLYSLDTQVRKIDPAWPVTAKKPELASPLVQPIQGPPTDEPQTLTSIHVNPRFLVKVRRSKLRTNESKVNLNL